MGMIWNSALTYADSVSRQVVHQPDEVQKEGVNQCASQTDDSCCSQRLCVWEDGNDLEQRTHLCRPSDDIFQNFIKLGSHGRQCIAGGVFGSSAAGDDSGGRWKSSHDLLP